MKTKLKRYAMPLSIVGCLILIYLCTIVGITSIPFGEANRILLHEVLHLPVNMEGISAGNIAIIWNVRLPRVILGFLTGGALAVCGAAYQGIFKNPMADPFILGVSSGAALGASIGIVMHFSADFLGLNGTAVLAFAGGLFSFHKFFYLFFRFLQCFVFLSVKASFHTSFQQFIHNNTCLLYTSRCV